MTKVNAIYINLMIPIRPEEIETLEAIIKENVLVKKIRGFSPEITNLVDQTIQQNGRSA